LIEIIVGHADERWTADAQIVALVVCVVVIVVDDGFGLELRVDTLPDSLDRLDPGTIEIVLRNNALSARVQVAELRGLLQSIAGNAGAVGAITVPGLRRSRGQTHGEQAQADQDCRKERSVFLRRHERYLQNGFT